MNVQTQIELFIQSELQKLFSQQKEITPGQRFTGRVIETRPEGEALIDFGSFRAVAKVTFPVTPGEVLPVTVLERGERLRLALVTPGSGGTEVREIEPTLVRFPAPPVEFFSRLLQEGVPKLAGLSTPLPPAVGEAVARLITRLDPVDPAIALARLPQLLKQVVEHSGLLLEKNVERAIQRVLDAVPAGSSPPAVPVAKWPGVSAAMVADLKPDLLLLRDFLSQAGPLRSTPLAQWLLPGDEAPPPQIAQALAAELRQGVDAVLNATSGQQREALASFAEGRLPVFHFTLPLSGAQNPARLKVYFPKRKGGRGRQGFRLSLLLDLGQLDSVRSDFFLVENALNVTLFVRTADIADLFARNLPDLEEALRAIFSRLTLAVEVSEQKIAAFESEDLPEGERGSERRVDLRI